MQFGEDWPGVFIRGDNAFFYAQLLMAADKILRSETKLDAFMLSGLRDLLLSADIRKTPEVQKLKDFTDCISGAGEDQDAGSEKEG